MAQPQGGGGHPLGGEVADLRQQGGDAGLGRRGALLGGLGPLVGGRRPVVGLGRALSGLGGPVLRPVGAVLGGQRAVGRAAGLDG
ncbi:hypothetical protein, partial [Streptomyces sp. NRRL S-495]|uniref:hypothetical protein n=1 Tax=Streptomyces sp. NRRL S-495 TaxID=1609133 RepID=UPI001900655D